MQSPPQINGKAEATILASLCYEEDTQSNMDRMIFEQACAIPSFIQYSLVRDRL